MNPYQAPKTMPESNRSIRYYVTFALFMIGFTLLLSSPLLLLVYLVGSIVVPEGALDVTLGVLGFVVLYGILGVIEAIVTKQV